MSIPQTTEWFYKRLDEKDAELKNAREVAAREIAQQMEDGREKDTEIERLKEDLAIQIKQVELWNVVSHNQKALIAELCDALDGWPIESPDLVQRGREATR